MRLQRPASSTLPRPSRVPALAAAAVLALTGLSACGGDDPDEASAPATSSSSSSSASEEPSATVSASASASEKASAKPSKKPAPPPEPATDSMAIAVTVSGDRVEPQNEVVEADIDTPIRLQITSDREGEMHVHSSPEQYIEFGPGTKTVDLVIENPGAIDVEEHDTGALVLKLLVQ